MTGKYIVHYFQYQEDVGCVGMLNGWFSSIDVICADNHNYFQFKLKGNASQCRRCCYTGACVWQDIAKVVDVPVVQLHRCSSWIDGIPFLGPCAQAHGQGLTPAIRAGKGWRGRWELAPRCSATQLGA